MEPSPSSHKRRIPKACAACRTSKVRCDGGKPCLRCRSAKVHCDYIKPPTDVVTERLERLEEQICYLSNRVTDVSTTVAVLQMPQRHQAQQPQPLQQKPSDKAGDVVLSPGSEIEFTEEFHTASLTSRNTHTNVQQNDVLTTACSPNRDYYSVLPSSRPRRSDFEIRVKPSVDVVARGLISYEEAHIYFETFFQGCDSYVPIFSSKTDTFDSVRARSSMLFDSICAVGCRAQLGPASDQYQSLTHVTKDPICKAMLGEAPKTIETIQALLVNACYSEKGWMLTSLALKLALDLNLQNAYPQLLAIILEGCDTGMTVDIDRDEVLFRQIRVWFGIFVLDHILSIDSGKQPGIKAGEDIRRCRILLRHPALTALDLRLLAQVELNSIRALAQERLSPKPGISLTDNELNETARDIRIDLKIWLSDWINFAESHIEGEGERSNLIVNLKIQKDWSEMVMLCKGLQGVGIDNVAIMSDKQRNLVHLAKASAHRHLSTMISDSKLYLVGLRYGMDFVWAKCAFSVLLLLKLARILPELTDMSQLISDVKSLYMAISQIPGSNNIYFHILRISVEKCERALQGDIITSNNQNSPQGEDMEIMDADTDFQSYVPKEFILDWSFPGLKFCFTPFGFGDLFMEFGTGF
ncbi:C6 zinc finger domain protein [Xylogone sp. PMI_703]|nr:C6 zinc finger domain protein [Xylogone sp. PMI_703]